MFFYRQDKDVLLNHFYSACSSASILCLLTYQLIRGSVSSGLEIQAATEGGALTQGWHQQVERFSVSSCFWPSFSVSESYWLHCPFPRLYLFLLGGWSCIFTCLASKHGCHDPHMFNLVRATQAFFTRLAVTVVCCPHPHLS